MPGTNANPDQQRRVCMIVMSRYPDDERVRREAAALERAGIGVDVICQRAEGEPAMERFGLVTAWRVMRQQNKENIIRYLWVAIRFMAAAFIKLQQLSLTRRYDAVQAHNMPDVLVLAGLVPHKLLGRPLVLDLHDLSVELYRAKWAGKKSARWLLPIVGAAEKISCAAANRLITTSEGFRGRLIQRGVHPEKITLVLNSPDPRHFRFEERPAGEPITRDLRLLYHGTVAPRFGLAEAIGALARVRERIPGARLAIYGKYDPSYREELVRKIGRLGLGEAVTLGGWISVQDIAGVVRQADIGLVPYLNDEFMRLALSTKTFEYAACGLPVAASRLEPVLTHFDKSSVELFEPGDEASMAEAVMTLAMDPQRRREHILSARKALEKISGEVMEARYVELMRKLVGLNGPEGERALEGEKDHEKESMPLMAEPGERS